MLLGCSVSEAARSAIRIQDYFCNLSCRCALRSISHFLKQDVFKRCLQHAILRAKLSHLSESRERTVIQTWIHNCFPSQWIINLVWVVSFLDATLSSLHQLVAEQHHSIEPISDLSLSASENVITEEMQIKLALGIQCYHQISTMLCHFACKKIKLCQFYRKREGHFC